MSRSLADRLWSKVEQRGSDECWPWTGSTNGKYGHIHRGGRITDLVYVHRVAWELHNGRIPVLDILHSCNNRLCCNPTHLREGTQSENEQDKYQAFLEANGPVTRPMASGWKRWSGKQRREE